jgi:fluoride exporter
MGAALAVAVGGGIGAVARWWMAGLIVRWTGTGFPWGTLAVNVMGGFLMGAIVQTMTHVWQPSTTVRLFLTTGLLGGFTTFSAFSLEMMTMIERGEAGWAFCYAIVSVALSVMALAAGLLAVRTMT